MRADYKIITCDFCGKKITEKTGEKESYYTIFYRDTFLIRNTFGSDSKLEQHCCSECYQNLPNKDIPF